MRSSHNVMKVSALHIYPIKSTAPITLLRAAVSKYGLEHDRRWALYAEDGQVLTGRQHPRLLDIQCSISASSCLVHHNSILIAELPFSNESTQPVQHVKIFSNDAFGSSVDPVIDRWFSDYLGVRCRLLQVNTSRVRPVLEKHGGQDGEAVAFADQAPVLITSESSLRDLNERSAAPILMNRFRPNIVVRDTAAFEEDDWEIIKIGSTTLRVIQQCERCVFTTIDPATKTKDTKKEPLTTLSKYRKSVKGGIIFGVHAVHIIDGTINVDDDVKISSYTHRPVLGS